MDYKDWSDEIAAQFFREDRAGERVYLHVSKDLVRRLGQRNGIDESECLDEFVAAVKEKHRYSSKYSIPEAALQFLKIESAWDELWEDSLYPPYTGILGLFVLAAGYNPENEFHQASYYPRLNSLLGRDPDRSPPDGFERMQEVWEHLEKWANQEQKGRLGIFEIQHLDERSHVGIPRSQRILTDQERKIAKWVFSQSGLHPSLSSSGEEVASLVRSYGRGRIRGQTYDILAPDSEHPKYRQAIIEALLEVLRSWDGSPVEIEKEEHRPTGYRGSLALSFRKAFGEVNLRLRCIAERDFPEGGLVLQDKSGNEYTCHEVMSGWSTELRDAQNNALDPSTLNLSSDYKLENPDLDWQFTLRPAKVRAFLKAKDKGVSEVGGYVETRQLPLGIPFYLLVQENADTTSIENWGESSCEDFEEVALAGVPEPWRLYRSEGALNDEGVHGKYDVLSQPREAQITFSGGVRVRPRANEYFSFAPPSIRVQGPGKIEVYLASSQAEDKQLESKTGELFEIPKEFRSSGEYRVLVKSGSELIRRKYFSLREHIQWREIEARPLGKFGFRQEEGAADGEFDCRDTIDLGETPLNLMPDAFGEDKLYLVGPTPGQVREWPSQGLPDDWQVVWAVPKEGQSIYCWPGDSPPDPQPTPVLNRPGGPRYPRSDIKKWKEILYHWRKRTNPPQRHNDLWFQYQQHAKKEC